METGPLYGFFGNHRTSACADKGVRPKCAQSHVANGAREYAVAFAFLDRLRPTKRLSG